MADPFHKDAGGCAFPLPSPCMTDGTGMSLRDWFAGQALATMIHMAQSRTGGWDEVAVAAGAYAVADAMLRERKRR